MSQQHSEKTTAFIDVTAYFSKEEWKLLHEWQKELYKNVMKEVHHALISLGPLIATTVVSLSAKEDEDLCSLDPEDLKKRCDLSHSSSDTIANPYVQFNLNKEDNQYLNYHQNSEEMEKNDCVITVEEERMVAKSLVTSSIKVEGQTYAMDSLNFEKRESISFPTVHVVEKSIVPFSIKEEMGSSSSDNQVNERRNSINVPTGTSTPANPVKQQQAYSWKRTSTNTEHGRNVSDKLDIINHHRSKTGEILSSSSGYSTSLNSMPHRLKQKETHREERQYVWTECRKVLRGSTSSNMCEKTQTVFKVCICSECGNTFKQSENDAAHHQGNRRPQQNTCRKCAKNLHKQTNLNNDQGKYLCDKPYTCKECGKGFQNSRTLIIHQRVHTGEKPYICSQCGKAFRQLPHLVVHQRLHTGEKPYICNVCDSRFINTSNLKRHQQIHTRD